MNSCNLLPDPTPSHQHQVVALVGHSAAGKTSSSEIINGSQIGDMDVGLGTERSPSLITALEWLTDRSRPKVVVVSNHEKMLKCLYSAILNNEYRELIRKVRFVYLHKPKDRLKHHLALPTSCGTKRPEIAQLYILDNYERFHTIFSEISDITIYCHKASIEEVAVQIRAISSRINGADID